MTWAKVDNCEECPFYSVNYEESVCTLEPGEIMEWCDKRPQKWCPLKRGPVKVRLAEKWHADKAGLLEVGARMLKGGMV